MPAAATHSGSSDEHAWVLPESLRSAFQRRYGPVRAGADAERAIRELTLFASCGDIVTAQAVELGNLPLIGIVDFKTQRNETIDPSTFAPLARRRLVRVWNPAAMLTTSLRLAVHELARSGGGLIEVDGEEDLGVMPLIEALPFGATVIYGIPGEGVSFISVSPEAKARVKALLDEMEYRRIDRGS